MKTIFIYIFSSCKKALHIIYHHDTHLNPILDASSFMTSMQKPLNLVAPPISVFMMNGGAYQKEIISVTFELL